mmetsp:Transcript_16744/g.47762  ORF Transcript_16744/g.47762 Transcript_16744/m.47762 type:complete len:465 (-) Transcript_16744:792-2186(-)
MEMLNQATSRGLGFAPTRAGDGYGAGNSQDEAADAGEYGLNSDDEGSGPEEHVQYHHKLAPVGPEHDRLACSRFNLGVLACTLLLLFCIAIGGKQDSATPVRPCSGPSCDQFKFVHDEPTSESNAASSPAASAVEDITTTAAPTSIPIPIPADQVAPNGFLCLNRPYGRTNNQVVGMRGGMVFAFIMKRTLVVPKKMAAIFDQSHLQDIMPRLVVPYDAKLCSKAKSNSEISKICMHREGCDLSDAKLVQKLINAAGSHRVVSMHGATWFRNAHWASKLPGFNLETAFYTNLYPNQSISRAADKFIEDNFKGRPFAAVHLRWLEGSCLWRIKKYNHGVGSELCSPNRDTFLEVMKEVVGHTDMPIFVASDRQVRPAFDSYVDKGDYLYKGPCVGVECPLIDFEIASRSNFFVGVIVSSASDTIAKLRRNRPVRHVGKYYRSVLSWSRDKELLAKFANATGGFMI